MNIAASILQIVGLFALIYGAAWHFGASGGLAAAGIALIYTGLAMDRDGA